MIPPASGPVPPTTGGSEITLEDYLHQCWQRECGNLERQDAQCSRLSRLWGDEPFYEEQAEDRSVSPIEVLWYTWIGDSMYRAAAESLTLEDFPRPIRAHRAYNGGKLLSNEVQRLRCIEHGWDGFTGLWVRRRLPRHVACKLFLQKVLRFLLPGCGTPPPATVPPGSVGILRWVGRAPVPGSEQQRYAGVEWRLPVEEDALHGPNVSAQGRLDGELHDGMVNGVRLFTTSDGAPRATCEPVEYIEFVTPPGVEGKASGAPARGGASRLATAHRMPSSMSVKPRGMQVTTALFRSLGRHLLLALPLRIVRDSFIILVPVLLQYFIIYIEKTGQHEEHAWLAGFGWTLFFFLFVTAKSAVTNKYYQLCFRCAYIYQSALSALVFEKCMTISTKALAFPFVNPGRVVNMLTSDVDTVEQFTLWLWVSLGATVQLIAGAVLLYLLVGWAAFIGMLALALPIPLQVHITRRFFSAVKAKAEITDARLKATNEFLSGIRVVKLMSWEPSFIAQIEEMRRVEVERLRTIQTLEILLDFVNSAVPNVSMGIVLLIYTLQGHALTASIAFPAISLLSIMEMPFRCFPLMVSRVVRFFVSLRRITRFVGCGDGYTETAPVLTSIEADWVAGATERCAEREAMERYHTRFAAQFDRATLSTYTSVRPSQAQPSKRSECGGASSSLGADPSPAVEGEDDGFYELVPKTLLSDVTLRIPRGKLTIILGPTGSGKSTLLDSLIGALEVTCGRVAAEQSVAYVPQQPWIMNATIRDNVLFFSDMDEEQFARAIGCTHLSDDLVRLADGIQTEIGEKGINLSGGQKARVSLARAVYANKELYLLDDPLSALDAHVGEQVVRDCILGVLSEKTRVLATHQVHFASQADYVVVLGAEGEVDFQGTAEAYAMYADMVSDLPVSPVRPSAGGLPSATVRHEQRRAAPEPGPTKEEAEGEGHGGGKLMTEEEMATGSVPLRVYLRYAEACGGVMMWLMILAVHLGAELVVVLPPLWLSVWSANGWGLASQTYLGVFLLCTLLAVVARPLRVFVMFPVLRHGSRVLHSLLLRSVSAGTMNFFDTTPMGRVLNRFSKDMDIIDSTLPDEITYLFSDACTALSSLVIMLCAQVFIALPLIPCGYVYYRLLVFFSAANRTIQRHVNISNSPVLSTLHESLSGRWTIEAYGKSTHMLQKALCQLDRVYACKYFQCVGDCWLAIRIECLSNVIVTGIALLGVLQVNRGLTDAGQVGMIALSMTMSMKISTILNEVINFGARLEANMNSVERIVHYVDCVDREDIMGDVHEALQRHSAFGHRSMKNNNPASATEGLGRATSPKGAFPSSSVVVLDEAACEPLTYAGTIEFRHVSMRYRPGLPLVLRNVTFTIRAGEKVGVVGRTGSGKSSLLLAFMRLVEVCEGEMIVCGRSAATYSLRALRQLFSMIPQDPLLFDGTIRTNVDPLEEAEDDAVWRALHLAGMADRVRSTDGGLDAPVREGGANLSVGQRQLLCLARALLRQGSTFLLMDEATANVDPALDQQIQQTVQHAFKGYTVVTIAHRLHTVAAYDTVLVMEAGELVECGAPRALLSAADSKFAALVHSMGEGAVEAFYEVLERTQGG